MIRNIRYSISGTRKELELLQRKIGLECRILDHQALSGLYVTLTAGTREHRAMEATIQKLRLDQPSWRVGRYEELEASQNELCESHLFTIVRCRWIEDDEDVLDRPSYTGRDCCSNCGKGSSEINKPLRGDLESVRRNHLIRLPPAIVIVSRRMMELSLQRRWRGISFEPLYSRRTGKEMDEFCHARIESILPPMHSSAQIERSGIPDHCDRCHRLGYQLRNGILVYGLEVLERAAEWNLSCEWLAPHYVSCPFVVCRREVVQEFLALEPLQKWIPVQMLGVKTAQPTE